MFTGFFGLKGGGGGAFAPNAPPHPLVTPMDMIFAFKSNQASNNNCSSLKLFTSTIISYTGACFYQTRVIVDPEINFNSDPLKINYMKRLIVDFNL